MSSRSAPSPSRGLESARERLDVQRAEFENRFYALSKRYMPIPLFSGPLLEEQVSRVPWLNCSRCETSRVRLAAHRPSSSSLIRSFFSIRRIRSNLGDVVSPSARPSKAVAGGHLGPTATAAATGNTAPMATCARPRHQPAAPSIWKGHAAHVSTRRTFFEPRRTTGGCLLHKKAAAAHGQQTSPATNQRREVAFKQPKTSINLHEPIPRHHEYTPKTLPMLQVHQTPTNRSAPMSAPLPQPPRTARSAL